MKKTNKKINLIFILLVVVFLSGCDFTNIGNTPSEKSFRTGNKGITISFLQNAPPNEVYEENPFSIGILLKNEGAYEVRNGIVSFSIEDEHVDVQRPENLVTFNLNGKSVSMPGGDQTTEFLRASTKKIESERRESIIIASLCYPYKTIADASVCIDTDIYNLKTINKVCYIRDMSFNSQGAPVAVTKIETKMLPGDNEDTIKPQFIIHIQNVNAGSVIKKEKVADACSSEPIGIDDLNIINVKAELSGEGLECSPNPSKLKDGKTSVRCVLEQGLSSQQATYTSPLKVELEYGYTSSISKIFLIKSSS